MREKGIKANVKREEELEEMGERKKVVGRCYVSGIFAKGFRAFFAEGSNSIKEGFLRENAPDDDEFLIFDANDCNFPAKLDKKYWK